MTLQRLFKIFLFGLMISASKGALAQSAGETSTPQSFDDAWWTGPMLANSAAPLPQGHVLIESYGLDVITRHQDRPESLTYMLYGVTDRFTIGPIPVFGVSRAQSRPGSSGVQLGDTGILAKYALTRSDPMRGVPDISLAVQENLQTGKYDRLGERPGNGFGNGAYGTVVSLYSQMYFWLPNGRLFRTRLDLSQGFTSRPRFRMSASTAPAPDFLAMRNRATASPPMRRSNIA